MQSGNEQSRPASAQVHLPLNLHFSKPQSLSGDLCKSTSCSLDGGELAQELI